MPILRTYTDFTFYNFGFQNVNQGKMLLILYCVI